MRDIPNSLKLLLEYLQEITGVELNEEKIKNAINKITTHYENLEFKDCDAYYKYFIQNKTIETKNLISILTNHTTEFFRETEHFDFLVEEYYPKFIKTNKKIRIWSAAASTGQEVYSLAISYLEACCDLGMNLNQNLLLEIIGTDIDAISIEKSQRGIYLKKIVEDQIGKVLIHKYFDEGEGELSKFVRLKEYVHNLCQFKVHNLLQKIDFDEKFDVIMLRNVLIYYKREEIKKIVLMLAKFLNPEGLLILGHSESLSGIDVPFTLIRNSIYKFKTKEVKDLTTVFIIDDSKTIREFLKNILVPDNGFQIVGEAENPVEAMVLLKNLKEPPHAITLDVNMPEMTGIEYLELIRNQPHPPIIVMSSVGIDDAQGGIRCLELGAFEYIQKPSGTHSKPDADKIRTIILQSRYSNKKYKCNQIEKEIKFSQRRSLKSDLIAIGSSTGGVEALQEILKQLKNGLPPIVIVQHIPENFSAILAARLGELTRLKVYEGKNSQILEKDCVYIAPGGKQMRVIEKNEKLILEVNDSERVNLHKPSVDYLFFSLIKFQKKYNICGIILTGMGSDGAKGLKALYDNRAYTIAQNEATCIVFGMPKEAIELGAVHDIVPLNEIPHILNNIDH